MAFLLQLRPKGLRQPEAFGLFHRKPPGTLYIEPVRQALYPVVHGQRPDVVLPDAEAFPTGKLDIFYIEGQLRDDPPKPLHHRF